MGAGLYLSASPLLLRRSLMAHPLPQRTVVLAGYAGWGPGQLDRGTATILVAHHAGRTGPDLRDSRGGQLGNGHSTVRVRIPTCCIKGKESIEISRSVQRPWSRVRTAGAGRPAAAVTPGPRTTTEHRRTRALRTGPCTTSSLDRRQPESRRLSIERDHVRAQDFRQRIGLHLQFGHQILEDHWRVADRAGVAARHDLQQ